MLRRKAGLFVLCFASGITIAGTTLGSRPKAKSPRKTPPAALASVTAAPLDVFPTDRASVAPVTKAVSEPAASATSSHAKPAQPATTQASFAKPRSAAGKATRTASFKPNAPPKRKSKWRPLVSPAYRRTVAQWHKPITNPEKNDPEGHPYLVLEVLNTAERIEIAPQGASGHFSALDLDRVSHALRDTRAGNEHPIDPDLVALVYDVQTHFASKLIRVVSGYRTPRSESRSNHGRGRAIDIIVPGARDEDVAAYVRSRGFVGVGVYPNSGFVHIDVRPASYFWIDRSGPGQRTREQAAGGACSHDERAKLSGRRPPTPYAFPANDVDSVWAGRDTRKNIVEQRQDDLEEDDLDAE